MAALVLFRRMTGRNPNDLYRSSTPLELLFDLCFIVAVAQAGIGLHHALVQDHIPVGLMNYGMVFFVIWWAWLNFTWFTSAYDTDDVPYRIATLIQIAGGLVLAAGIPAVFEHQDFRTIAGGYVLMRSVAIGQWLRVVRADPTGRPAAIRYAAGVGVLVICWMAQPLLPLPWRLMAFVALASAELVVPVWAELRGNVTPWHPGHINERFGCFTLITLGEAVAAATAAVQSSVTDHGPSAALLVVAAGGLLLMFGLWWSYFAYEATEALRVSARFTFLWGYVHYGIFAAVAAIGAGLAAASDSVTQTSHISSLTTGFAVAVPVATYMFLSGWLRRQISRMPKRIFGLIGVGELLILASGFVGAVNLPLAVLFMSIVVALVLAGNLVLLRRSENIGP